MKNYTRVLLAVASCFVLSINNVFATPTGLNNIPTADIVPEKTLCLQVFADYGKDNKPDYFTGFKYGLIENLEIGLDGRIFPEAALEETITAQVKYGLGLTEKLSASIGVANVGDHAETGWEDPYAVITYDLDLLRAHLGGSLQRNDEGFFAGLDKTISFFEKDLTLRTDIIQTNDADDAIISTGFIYDLGHNVLLESWVSFPTESGKEEIVIIKLDYVIKF